MRAFLLSQDDRSLIRYHSPANPMIFQPDIIIQPPSTDRNALHDSAGGESVSHHSQSAYGSKAGLSFGASTSRSSEPSIATSYGVKKVPNINRALNIGEEGQILPQQSGPSQYECPFDRLRCPKIFNSYESWYEHSLTHFQHHEPPAQNVCCFCSSKFDKKNGGDSWRARLEHVKRHHDQGERLATSRFDQELYRYLWQKGLIDNVEYKDFTSTPSTPTSRVSVPRGNTTNFNTHLTIRGGL